MSPFDLPSPGPVIGSSPPLRIALLISSLEAGGAERVCATLANHWARLGHEVTVMTFDTTVPDAFSLAPEVHRANIGRGDLSASMWHRLRKSVDRVRRVRKQLVARHIDVAVAFMSPANMCLAVAGRGLRTVCIGSERTYPPALYLTH